MKPKGNPNPTSGRGKDDFPGYPHYGKEQDIYSNAKEEQNIDPERPDRTKTPNTPPNEPIKSEEAGEFIEGSNQPGSQEKPSGAATGEDIDEEADEDGRNEADLTEDDRLILDDTPMDANERMANQGHDTMNDMDVPGAELDDAQEELGSEDEENNYYSLGGDNHDDDSREPDTYGGR